MATRQTRGGGKGSSREEERSSDPLLDRDLARRRGGRGGETPFWRWLPGRLWQRLALGLAVAFLLVLVVASARAADAGLVAVPAQAARVTDQAGMLTAQQRSALEGVLADYERKSGSQIAVLLLPSTAPEAIEQFSIRVADAWKLGRRGVDDGVLLVVAKDNPAALRRMRIEAGRGVQGTLTDAQSKRVLQDVIAPHFRQNDFYGGLVAGVGAIATLLDKEQFPAPAAAGGAAPQGEDGSFSPGWVLPLLLFGIFVVLPLMRGGRRSGLRRGGWGSDASGVLLGAALGNALSAASRGGGGSSWGGGDFGGDSGGFSGGGGSFDGGGASGDW